MFSAIQHFLFFFEIILFINVTFQIPINTYAYLDILSILLSSIIFLESRNRCAFPGISGINVL